MRSGLGGLYTDIHGYTRIYTDFNPQGSEIFHVYTYSICYHIGYMGYIDTRSAMKDTMLRLKKEGTNVRVQLGYLGYSKVIQGYSKVIWAIRHYFEEHQRFLDPIFRISYAFGVSIFLGYLRPCWGFCFETLFEYFIQGYAQGLENIQGFGIRRVGLDPHFKGWDYAGVV